MIIVFDWNCFINLITESAFSLCVAHQFDILKLTRINTKVFNVFSATTANVKHNGIHLIQ